MRFLANPFRYSLDALYRFEGGLRGSREVEIGAPITLVHDVSREAELGQGFMSQAAVQVTTAGAGAQAFATKTRVAFLEEANQVDAMRVRGLQITDVEVWLLGWHAVVGASQTSNFVSAAQGLRFGIFSGGGIITPLQYYDTAGPLIRAAAATRPLYQDRAALDAYFGQPAPPALLVPDDNETEFLMTATDNAGAAIDVTGYFVCWIGPKGTAPLFG